MELLLLSSFGNVISTIFYVLLAILILLVMITVHEFGHFIAGKILGFGIEEFAIGFGPKLFKKQCKAGHVFSIRVLPIGGFCSFTGEDDDSTDPKAFNNRKPWQRIIVLISGALMNYLLAVVLIMAMFGIYGQTTFMTYKVAPSDVYSIEQSFQDKDVILTLNGKNIYLTTDMMSAIEGKSEGDLISATVIRNGEKKDITVALREYTDFKNLEDNTLLYKALGIYYEIDDNGAMINGGLYSTSVKVGFFQTIGRSFEYSFKIAGTIFTVIGQLLTGSLGLTSMGGTVTTISVAADAIRIGGLRYFFNIASFIGVNLAVFNLLPIPALDGSRTVFTAVEWIRRKPLNRRVEAIIHGVGLVVLLLFSVCVDLLHCF